MLDLFQRHYLIEYLPLLDPVVRTTRQRIQFVKEGQLVPVSGFPLCPCHSPSPRTVTHRPHDVRLPLRNHRIALIELCQILGNIPVHFHIGYIADIRRSESLCGGGYTSTKVVSRLFTLLHRCGFDCVGFNSSSRIRYTTPSTDQTSPIKEVQETDSLLQGHAVYA